MKKNEDLLTRFEALEVYRAIKKSNPKIKQDIKKLRKEFVNGLSKHDRTSGVWFLNIFKKVMETRSTNISLEALQTAYNTKDKEIISKKLIAYYCNFGIAIGAILGSAGGILGFLTATYTTFGEIACLSYFKLCLIYDLSVLYGVHLDEANSLEVYRILKNVFDIKEEDLSKYKVNELVDKGARRIEDKLAKDDSQKVLQGVLQNLGTAIIHKSVKNLIAKMIPLFGVVSGILICTTEDYNSVKMLGNKTISFYEQLEKLSSSIV